MPDPQISMIRSTPPRPAGLEDALRTGFETLAREHATSALIRAHRFGGTPEDKAAAATWLGRQFGAAPDADRIIVVNSAQNGMLLVLQHLLKAGDTLLTEELSYHGLRKIAGLLGINVTTIAMDHDGAMPEAFDAACAADPRARLLFLMPTLHNPTTIVMSAERRRALIEVARRRGVKLFEDDVYAVTAHDAPPPFAALAPDVSWQVTSFAKCLGPGLRIGYLVAPDAGEAKALVDGITGVSTWFAAPMSAVLARLWIEDGTMARLAEGVRDEAIVRQGMAAEHLAGHPYDGRSDALFVWLKLPQRWTQDGFCAAAGERGVLIRPGYIFASEPARSPHAIRVVLGSPETRPELDRGLAVIADLLAA